MLDEFCALCGYNRSYAARALRKGPHVRSGGKKRAGRPYGARGQGRKPLYGPEVLEHLRKI